MDRDRRVKGILRGRATAASAGLAALAAAALFTLIYGGPGLVWADAPYWRNPFGDMAINLAGSYAAYDSPWGWPPGATRRLIAPAAMSIVYTDSLPLATLALKGLGLGRAVSPLGLFLALSYGLQPLAMWRLMRACGAQRPETLAAGALLSLTYPAWLARQFGHVALSGHWIILFALALSVRSAQTGLTWRRAAGFAGLGLLAAGLHAYHLIPVAAALGAALLAEAAQKGRRATPKAAAAGLAALAAVGLTATTMGYQVGGVQLGGPAVLGHYSMNLLGPVTPQASALMGQAWNGEWFEGTIDPTGGQAFEGYNYLGAGILTAMLAGAAATAAGLGRRWSAAGGRPRGPAATWAAMGAPIRAAGAGDSPGAAWAKRYGPLAAAMAMLFVLAVGPTGYAGPYLVYQAPKPDGALGYWLSGFRCHGRFFWAVGYLGLAGSLAAIERRMERRTAAAVLAAAVALQAYDVSQLATGVRSRFAAPAPLMYPKGLERGAQGRARDWRFYPTAACSNAPIDTIVMAQVSLMGIRQGGTSNSTPTARPPAGACPDRPAEALTRTAARGDRTVTVALDNGRVSGGLLEAFSGRSDCYRFLHGVMCGWSLDGVDGLDPVAGSALKARPQTTMLTLDLGRGQRPPALAEGWSVAEPGHIWSDGRRATIHAPAPAAPTANGVTVTLEAMGFSESQLGAQHVVVSAGDEMLTSWDALAGYWQSYTVTVPERLIGPGRSVRLTLQLPQARSTKLDRRLLGLAVRRLTVCY